MDKTALNDFVAQLHTHVTVPAYTASLGFLASAARGNPKYAAFKGIGDCYREMTEVNRKSLNEFVYAAIHYGCFSFIDFMERYGEQDEANTVKSLVLVLKEAGHEVTSPVDLFATAEYQLRTMFRRFAHSEEWKNFLSGLTSIPRDEGTLSDDGAAS